MSRQASKNRCNMLLSTSTTTFIQCRRHETASTYSPCPATEALKEAIRLSPQNNCAPKVEETQLDSLLSLHSLSLCSRTEQYSDECCRSLAFPSIEWSSPPPDEEELRDSYEEELLSSFFVPTTKYKTATARARKQTKERTTKARLLRMVHTNKIGRRVSAGKGSSSSQEARHCLTRSLSAVHSGLSSLY